MRKPIAALVRRTGSKFNAQEKLMVERPLRIGFLTTEYPTEGYTGGIGSYVRQVAHALLELGHSPFVLLCVPSDGELTWDGPVPIYRVGVSGFASRLPEPLGRGASLVFARNLARLAGELRLDLLEAPEWGGLTAFLDIVKPSELRVVVRLHTCSSIVRRINKSNPESIRERFDWRLRDWLEKRSILTADAVTAVSKAIGEETRRSLRLVRNDFQVVPNSVNDSAFSSADNMDKTGSPVVLFVGRLEWRKGPDLLIRALPAVLKQHPNALFQFAGMDTLTGPGNTSMRFHLDGLLPDDARSHVDFCGHLVHAQLEELWREATVCVFPSRYEGLPMVCLEAMARGKAIVATNIPGFCELISDGKNGVIVGGEDPEALACALSKMISDDLLRARLGRAARETARSHFHGSVVAESMLRVYRDCMNATKSRRRKGSEPSQGLA
jgi:glycosyltransferase involved in cell wall biosynthesis